MILIKTSIINKLKNFPKCNYFDLGINIESIRTYTNGSKDVLIKHIITELEDVKADLNSSIDNYNRMMLLNMHIQEQFKQKANEIKKTYLGKNNKSSSKITK